MSLNIKHNMMAMTAQRNLGSTYGKMGESINALSSGLRVNSADDDAAGLAVREQMRAQVKSLNQGIRNANDGISMLQTMDGAAQVIDEKLVRMKELAEQAATGTYDADQRSIMDNEFSAMRDEIDRIAQATDFNGINGLTGGDSYSLENVDTINEDSDYTASASEIIAVDDGASIDGVNTGDIVQVDSGVASDDTLASLGGSGDLEVLHSAEDGDWIDSDGTDYEWDADNTNWTDSGTMSGTGEITIHFGPGNDPAQDKYDVGKQDMTSEGLGIDTLDISDQEGAQDALETLDAAIETKDEGRAKFGATMNRLKNTVTATEIQAEKTQAAEAQISDVDVASEMADLTRNQVLAQAGVSMLSQANSIPQMATQLLQG